MEKIMRLEKQTRVALATLALLFLFGGCGKTPDNKNAEPQKDSASTAPAVPPLASVKDPKEFASELQVIRNQHITTSARYLTQEGAGYRANNARPPGPSSDVQIQAYPLRAALWDNPIIETCWENPTQGFASQMSQVQQAIADTWQAASRLQFEGWQRCAASSPATQQVIRIQIDDSDPQNGPRTLGLGKQLAGVTHGMLLNFTFLRWGTNCQTMTDYCIKAIAVHEFGHAIGFAHEQNRPDKPGECMDAPQGSNGDDTILTPYDPHSVMNYCNKVYNNDGKLSDLDRQAVQQLYGAHP